ncbi:MAG: adenylyl-sulfate kinase [Defluviicoccus sp.]|nr:adenylyl-sulfate kinase [Defluviicoccus sp.]
MTSARQGEKVPPALQASGAARGKKERLRFVICGADDDGRSALLNRLLGGPGAVTGERRGTADPAPPAEPERWIADDISYRSFGTGKRSFVAIDAPAGAQYARSLIAGASRADAAVVLVDAGKGIPTHTRRDGYIVSMMGIRKAILAVHRMDPVDFDEGAFTAIVEDFRAFAGEAGIESVDAVPVCTPTGENVRAAGGNLLWYGGPTLLELLEAVDIRPDPAAGERPSPAADRFAVHLVWLDAEPMLPERPYGFRFAGGSAVAQITDLTHRVDVDSLGRLAAKTLDANQIGYCKIALDRPIPFDAPAGNRASGPFVLVDRFTDAIVGAGVIGFALRRASNVVWHDMKIDKTARARATGQQPCVVWMTGLSGAGKSTIADRLEQKLQTLGKHTYLLDGDNVRHGLNKDLGFTDRDRVENIRRVAEVAKLMVDAGLIVIVSFISPFRSERRMARDLMEEGEFFEIFVDTPLEVCEARDPKGLYAKARKGDLVNFTGIDSPYEAPENPELRIETTEMSAELAADEVVLLLGGDAGANG